MARGGEIADEAIRLHQCGGELGLLCDRGFEDRSERGVDKLEAVECAICAERETRRGGVLRKSNGSTWWQAMRWRS